MLKKGNQVIIRRYLLSLLLVALLFMGPGSVEPEASMLEKSVPTELCLNVGDSLSLEALPSSYKVESTNPQVVSVSQDSLIAKRAGTVKILFQVGQKTKACTVKVTRTNAKIGVYEYIYPDKSGATDSITVLARNQGEITFVICHEEKDFKVVTKEITVALNGNETATFLWKDDQGGIGLGKCLFTGKNVTVTMCTRVAHNSYQWWEQSYPMTLTQASIKAAES